MTDPGTATVATPSLGPAVFAGHAVAVLGLGLVSAIAALTDRWSTRVFPDDTLARVVVPLVVLLVVVGVARAVGRRPVSRRVRWWSVFAGVVLLPVVWGVVVFVAPLPGLAVVWMLGVLFWGAPFVAVLAVVGAVVASLVVRTGR